MTPGARAAALILAHKDELARRMTGAMYDADPTLLERYGARGRGKCLQDFRYNLEHLAPAVCLRRPDMFAGYVRWLADMLAARGVGGGDVQRCLETMNAALRDRLEPPEADAVSACTDAGLAVLADSAGARGVP